MKSIKKALLVTFDFTQRGKSGTGLAAGCLLSACRAHKAYGEQFEISHLPVKMDQPDQVSAGSIGRVIQQKDELSSITHIALACYAWSDRLIEPQIRLLRGQGFQGKFILGGYEIQAENCKIKYPGGDAYIVGNGELSLIKAILSDYILDKVIYKEAISSSQFQKLPSPYLSSTISLKHSQPMVHWESKRGCNFKCNFCKHRDLTGEPVKAFGFDKIREELDLFKAKDVQKINVLDPVFNKPKDNHLEILEYCLAIGLEAELNLQVRFEFITIEFLELCKRLNVFLEFGLQTAIPVEYKVIDRPNNLRVISSKIKLLHRFKQPYQVSLIYGLPLQTACSFKESIAFLRKQDVQDIVAFPLMLLEGTRLKNEANKWELTEKVIDESLIPHVVSSSTFSENEYAKMQTIANQLKDVQADVAA